MYQNLVKKEVEIIFLRIFLLTSMLIYTLNAKNIFTDAYKKIKLDSKKVGWQLDLNRIAINFSQTSLVNEKLYAKFPDTNIKGASQILTQFFLRINANYYSNNFVFFNSFLSEYGLINIKNIKTNAYIKTKTLDRILLTTDYTQRIWDIDLKLEKLEIGPYVALQYQSEFIPTTILGRQLIGSFKSGFKAFDGKYVKNFHFSLFGERDFNPNIELSSFGIETGVEFEYKFSDDIKFSYNMNFKDYLFDISKNKFSPEYQFRMETRLDSILFNNFALSPFFSMYILKGRFIPVAGYNTFFGISLSFGKILKNANIKETFK